MSQRVAEETDDTEIVYMLMKDRVGKVLPKNWFEKKVSSFTKLLTGEQSTPYQAIRGSLYKELPQNLQPVEKKTVALVSIENKQHVVEVSLQDIREIPNEHADMLLAVPSCIDRFDIMNSRDVLRSASAAKVGDSVIVDMDQGEPKGALMYKGRIQKQQGIHFGVKLNKKLGSSNGSVAAIKYFTCEDGHGLFVPLNKITFSKSSQNTKDNGTKTTRKLSRESRSTEGIDHLKVGMRVIAFTDKGKKKTLRGTIRYLDRPTKNSEVVAGLEMDEKLEKVIQKENNIVHSNKKLFPCSNEKYWLTDPKTLLNEEDFDEDAGDITEAYTFLNEEEGHDKSNLPNLKREVTITPEVKPVNPIKEQENIWKKFEEKKELERLRSSQPNSLQPDGHLRQMHRENNVVDHTESSKRVTVPTENEMNAEKTASELWNEHENAIIILKKEMGIDNLAHENLKETSFVENQPLNKRGNHSLDDRNVERHPVPVSNMRDFTNTYDRTNRNILSSINNTDTGYLDVNQSDRKRQNSAPIRLLTKDMENVPGMSQKIHENGMHRSQTERQRQRSAPAQFLKKDIPNSANYLLHTDDTLDNDLYGGNISDLPPRYQTEKKLPQESRDFDLRQQAGAGHPLDYDDHLQIGSMAQIMIASVPHYGVIRWKGITSKSPSTIAGLELENTIQGGTDGTFQGERFFNCPAGRGFFCKLSTCRPDQRFDSIPSLSSLAVEIESVEGCLLPATRLEQKYIGRKKGVQGHHNSCYMDATIFAMYSFAHVFDTALHRKKRSTDVPEYERVQRILKEQIVNPLRKNGYVQHQAVMELRKCLNDLGDIGGFLNEEKDPEEFVVLLFEKVLQIAPFVKLRSGNGREETSHLYQIFAEKDDRNPLPSIQYLLELSFLTANLQLAETPSVMVLQMPRFGLQKLYKRIQINPMLDITPILSNVRQSCVVCGEHASTFCQYCACHFGWDNVYAYLCRTCWDIVHSHPKRRSHPPQPVRPEQFYASVYEHEPERAIMELFAVVCIKTSHYVSFVKCGTDDDESWVFFDSMADRCGGESGYNIPQVSQLNELKRYLYGQPLDIADLDKKSDERIVRLYEDASLCFYRNKKVTMYK